MSWVFKRFLSTVVLIGGFALMIQVHAQDQSGFISIDCGLPENSSYREVETGITFISDAAFINTGQSKILLPANQKYEPFLHLRSFPDGTRNCYRINVTRGNKYLTRASFFYGIYDEADSERLPAFELHLGPNLWDSVRFMASLDKIVKELIHVPSRNYIHVCLVNTGSGVPFISAIELRPLPRTIYNHSVDTQTGSLALIFRYYTRQATPNSTVYRYPDDVHDRLWYPYFGDYWTQLSTSSANYSEFGNDYRPPFAVMTTAATPNDANDSLIITWPVSDQKTGLYHVNMHFAEVEKLKPNQSRKLTISVNPMAPHLAEFSPHYLSTTTFTTEGQFNYFSVAKSEGSTLPPIINAVEVYVIKQFPEAEQTNQDDVDAITSIKSAYKLKMNWQGDPCAPQAYVWQGVKCSYPEFESPRIISLDLSSSGLTGEIASFISNLTMIQTLDLSNNNLTGIIPESLSRLPKLKGLNLNQNNLIGSIPARLIDKKKDGLIAFLSLCGNPYMSGEVYCEKKHSPFILIVAVCGSLLILILVGVIIWKCFYSKKNTGQLRVPQPEGRSRPRRVAQPRPPIPSQPKIPSQAKPVAQPNPQAQSNLPAVPSPPVLPKLGGSIPSTSPAEPKIPSQSKPVAQPNPQAQSNLPAVPSPPALPKLGGSIPSTSPAQPKIPSQAKPVAQPNPQAPSNLPAVPSPPALPKLSDQPPVASGSALAQRPSKPVRGKKFTKSEITEITSKKTFLGRGGFGPVFLGTLNGFEVAVKIRAVESGQGSEELQREVDVLMKVHHKNLVALIGYCDEEGMMALVYEYVAGGNLQQRILSPGETGLVLTWEQRLGIAIDVAQGLVYLHNHCEPPIIHRDMKTENILLTEKLQAKIADLGLSKFLPTETATHVSTNAKGTFGYLDPEYYQTQRLNKKSDVYSFGIVLLQLITGRRAIERGKNGLDVNIADRVRGLCDVNNIAIDCENIVEAKIQGSYTISSAQKAIRIAMLCVCKTALERPDTDSVLAELKASLEGNA